MYYATSFPIDPEVLQTISPGSCGSDAEEIVEYRACEEAFSGPGKTVACKTSLFNI
jgi:hypothetical protein